ncbi:NAD-dependent succinate-semialdehyde dehydrogenase [Achromobacter aloeverae]
MKDAAHSYPELALLIDGEWLDAAGRPGRTIANPATGAALGALPYASEADLARALAAAERAMVQWRAVSAYDRAVILNRAAALLRERCEAIATALTLEQGKPLAEARGEILTAADIFAWNAEEGRRAYGRIVPSRTPGQRNMVVKEPIGVVAAFAPWNFPAATAARKIAGSLAAGCACIIKPAEETPATALALARALVDAGLPAGVLNVVFGEPADVSGYLLRSPIVRKVSFTGSTAVGIQLTTLAAADVKRCTMELGGHAPVIVCDDVDPQEAAALAVAAKYRNAGQICVAPTRFYVQEGIFDAFAEAFAQAAAALVVGNGLDAATQMGPLANPRRIAAMETLTAEAVSLGGKCLTGGKRLPGAGHFYAPTVLAEVPEQARIMNEEPFGPVAILNRYAELPDALRAANRLRYGLAAYAHTHDARRAQQIADGIQAGTVGLNTYTVTQTEMPFGGMDHSGDGKEGGIEGLDGYLLTKMVMHLP